MSHWKWSKAGQIGLNKYVNNGWLDKRMLCVCVFALFSLFFVCPSLRFFYQLPFDPFSRCGNLFWWFRFWIHNICKCESISIFKPKFSMLFFLLPSCSHILSAIFFFFCFGLRCQDWDLMSIYWRQLTRTSCVSAQFSFPLKHWFCQSINHDWFDASERK